MTRLARALPILQWLPRYKRDDLPSDLTAGLTTAVMLVPQAMAYAMLAGLPPIIGLYASTVPLVVYALFGTSRQLAVGPVAMVSLMVASGVGALAVPGTDQYVALAVLLGLIVGVIQLGMGLVRAGFLTNFLSHPVVSGFTSAAALVIGFSQLKHLLGVDIARSHHVHEIVAGAFSQLGAVNPATLAIGLGAIAILLGLRRLDRRIPGALVVVVLGTLAVKLFGLDEAGVAIVGTVPEGLPAPSVPAFSWSDVTTLLPTALVISLIGFMESISVARAFARRHRYDIDPNKELAGLGAANIAGSMFGSYAVTGGFSRTAVNDQAGARTPLASIVTAALVAITLLFLTPLFFYLPKAVLAAIVMVAVFGLVDVKEVRHLWRVDRGDLALLGLTFVASLALGIELGLAAGVAASLLWFIVRSTRPHMAVLGRLPGTRVYRNVANFPEARRVPGVLHLRVDAQFYFGNVTFLKAAVRRELDAAPWPVRAVVIDASSINRLDSSADGALHEMAVELGEQDVELWFAGVKGPVRERMRRSGFVEELGADRFVHEVADAFPEAPLVAPIPQTAA